LYGIKYHNWWDNLREATQQCNQRNVGTRSDNTSGVKGVTWHKRDKQWVAQICVNKKNKSIGYYADFDDAVCARLAAEQCVDWAGCDSSSPAYQYVTNIQQIYGELFE